MKKLLVAFLGMCIVLTAYAEEWASVASSNKVAVAVNSERIEKDGQNVRAWVVYVEPSEGTMDVAYTEMDCREKRHRILKLVRYLLGKVEKQWETPGAWSYVSIGTLGETTLLFACGKPKKLPFYFNADDLTELEEWLQFNHSVTYGGFIRIK